MANEGPAVSSPELLHSAVENIVRNALRYTADQTEVEVPLLCKAIDDHFRGQGRQFGAASAPLRLNRLGFPLACARDKFQQRIFTEA